MPRRNGIDVGYKNDDDGLDNVVSCLGVHLLLDCKRTTFEN
jgi:hypothetical protein